MSKQPAPNEPVPHPTVMHLYRPNNPGRGVVTKNEVCTASRKAAGFVRHIEIDVSGTELEGQCIPGQSIGVIAPGEDAKGKPHKVRLYSLASPSAGEDGEGKIVSTTVKRTIDEHWDDHSLFLGVCSNFLCDAQPGDELILTGPAGKRFVLPEDPSKHDYLFVATGTGIAPFRGMLLELLAKDPAARVTLIMGAPYASDLIYHDQFVELESKHENFSYLTAISRAKQEDGLDRMYVHGRLSSNADQLVPLLDSERTLVYVCGIAGMEIGILQEMARVLPPNALEQYLRVDPEVAGSIDDWNRKMLHKQISPTRRVLLEVYA